MSHPNRTDDPRRSQRELSALADAVCRLIVSTDYPEIDIAIEIEKVRSRCEELFPDRLELFEMVYGSRFDRLREQWRSGLEDEEHEEHEGEDEAESD